MSTLPEVIDFRRVTADDLLLLRDWLSRPHVVEWWGEPPTLAEVEADYVGEHAFLALEDDRPIGYVQLYTVMGVDPEWWTDETDPGARGIDQFLAHEADLGRGLGTEMIARFVERIFDDPAVTKIQVDPSPDNARAIRAYEKVGFRREREVVTPDGPALLMVLRRA